LILLSPHFVGLDAGASRISMLVSGCSVYSNQKNPVFNKMLVRGAPTVFNDALLLSRQDGMRKIVKAMKDGYRFYYLPDMDFGPRNRFSCRFLGCPPRLFRLCHGWLVLPGPR
jgi:KDO2-lipid IV(A) lauroyltransferase